MLNEAETPPQGRASPGRRKPRARAAARRRSGHLARAELHVAGAAPAEQLGAVLPTEARPELLI